LGLLVEESRTNLLVRSEEFDTASWGTAGGTSPRVGITSNQATAPDGKNTADLAVPNAVTDDHVLFQANLINSSSKPSGYTTLQLVFTSAFNNNDAWANFMLTGAGSIGFVGSAATATVNALANGWYRCRITATSGASVSNAGVALIPLDLDRNSRNPVFAGDGTSGIYIWGAQLEEGSFPTSYIPTEGSAVTRAADVASISGSNFSSWYRQDEGSAFVDFTVNGVTIGANHFVYDFSDGTINEEIFLNYQSTGNARWAARLFSNQVTQDSLGSNLDRVKHAFGMESNNYMVARDGVLSTGSSQSGMPAIASFVVGSRFNGSLLYNGTIRRLTYWPVRLGNTTLQQITQ
jgi:hypothetical protein